MGPRDQEVYRAAGYGAPLTLGRRPVLMVVDVTLAFLGREPLPVLESVKRYPNSCGESGWEAVTVIARLLGPARALGRPVIYSTGPSDRTAANAGLWAHKHPDASRTPADGNTIPGVIAPRAQDIVVPKTKPSLFHATPLLDLLIRAGADTLVVTGGTTSGCIRATVVDAFSHNFPVLVVEDAVFDRGQLSHAVNLFEMDQKYATVASSARAFDYLAALTADGRDTATTGSMNREGSTD